MTSLVEKLNRICSESIKAASPRYTPGVETGAPNLEIASLSAAIDSLSQSPRYKVELDRLALSIHNAWQKAPDSLKLLFRGRVRTPVLFAELLVKLSNEKPGLSKITLGNLSQVSTQTISQSCVKLSGAFST